MNDPCDTTTHIHAPLRQVRYLRPGNEGVLRTKWVPDVEEEESTDSVWGKIVLQPTKYLRLILPYARHKKRCELAVRSQRLVLFSTPRGIKLRPGRCTCGLNELLNTIQKGNL